MNSNGKGSLKSRLIAIATVVCLILIALLSLTYLSSENKSAIDLAITGNKINENKRLTIYFVRHGKTDANVNNVFAGCRTDAKLIEEGIEATKRTGDSLKGIRFQRVYTSELTRTKDTASIILSGNNNATPKILTEPLLNDIDWGDIEGMTREEVFRLYPDFSDEGYIGNVNDRSYVSSIHATSKNKMVNNFYEALRTICKESEDGANVLVVGHSSFAWLLDVMFLDEMKDVGGLNNSSISVLEYEKGKWTLKQVNIDADKFNENQAIKIDK